MTERSLVSDGVRTRVRGWAVPFALVLGRIGLTPNGLTLIGFVGTCVAAFAAASQAWVTAGILVIVFGIFDLFDGTLARATGRASRFGAFLDSTLDRTGEGLVLAGIAIGCAAADFPEGAAVASLALAFASVVTYSRAKAEAIGLRGDVGIAPRPERLVLVSLGLVLAGLFGGVGRFPEIAGQVRIDEPLRGGSIVLLILVGMVALFSAITIVQRILHVKQQLEEQENS